MEPEDTRPSRCYLSDRCCMDQRCSLINTCRTRDEQAEPYPEYYVPDDDERGVQPDLDLSSARPPTDEELAQLALRLAESMSGEQELAAQKMAGHIYVSEELMRDVMAFHLPPDLQGYGAYRPPWHRCAWCWLLARLPGHSRCAHGYIECVECQMEEYRQCTAHAARRTPTHPDEAARCATTGSCAGGRAPALTARAATISSPTR